MNPTVICMNCGEEFEIENTDTEPVCPYCHEGETNRNQIEKAMLIELIDFQTMVDELSQDQLEALGKSLGIQVNPLIRSVAVQDIRSRAKEILQEVRDNLDSE